MTQQSTEVLKVSDRAREAAADLWCLGYPQAAADEVRARINRGELDGHETMQAFARFERATLASQSDGGEADDPSKPVWELISDPDLSARIRRICQQRDDAINEASVLGARCPNDTRAETAWLIEHGGHSMPTYWTGESWGRWSSDHKRACRFARREDAHKVSLALGDTPHDPPHKIIEHAWSGGPVAATPNQFAEIVETCARIADMTPDDKIRHSEIAAAIRSLKDNPHG